MMTKSKVIREALKELNLDDPSANKEEVVRTARERMKQHGGNEFDITLGSVRDVLKNIKKKLGGPVNRLKVEQYEQLPGVSMWDNQEETTTVPTSNGPSSPSPQRSGGRGKTKAVRRAMCMMFDEGILDLNDSRSETTKRICSRAEKLLEEWGYPQDVSPMIVSNARHELKRDYGPPITKEKIEKYEKRVEENKPSPAAQQPRSQQQEPTPDNGESSPSSSKKKTKKPSGYTLIRQILKQLSPEQLVNPDVDRIMVLVRPLVQRHKVNLVVSRHNVNEVIRLLRKKIKAPLTPENIQEYEDHIADYKKQSRSFGPPLKKSSPNPTEEKVGERVGMDMDSLITNLHDALHFSQGCGGVDNAIHVLNKLKGLQKP